jgi:RNA polymerase sigma-54 factor
MTFDQRLDIKQAQTLVVTPQLQQAIGLLQLSNQELSHLLDQEMDQNPLLTHQTPSPSSSEKDSFGEISGAGLFEQGDTCPQGQDFDNTWTNNNIYSNDTVYRSKGGSQGEGFSSFIESIAAEKPDLKTYLVQQINADFFDPIDNKIAIYCCDLVDESGYFRGEVSEVATTLGIGEERVLLVLERLQQLDPPGIFARSLKECLRLQLKEKGRLDPAIDTLVENLELLASHEIGRLEKMCGVSREDFIEMIEEIRHLNPKPGALFHMDPPQIIIPDILMTQGEDGQWRITLNQETLPKIRVDKTYYGQMKSQDPETHVYLKKCFSEAQALIKAVHQRAETILKVAGAIVKHQWGFFARGVEGLKPLVLKDIAADIGMHESTISRVTTNKFMSTPRGVFELKYFFSSGVSGGNSEMEVASQVVRHKIKNLIEGEVSTAPFSDDSLVQKLALEGIILARRTVAKYRDSLGIPSSIQRKKEKANVTRIANLSLSSS